MIQDNNRIRSLDIIKGIAMIMVIMVHFEQSFGLCKWFYYLQMGCPVFFVCSGYGIVTLINKRYCNLLNDRTELRGYFFSRFKALAPGWYMALIFIFLVNTIILAITGHTLSFGSNRSPISILINVAFLNGLFPFCNNNVMPGGWYIGTTAILYCLTPLIFWLINKSKNRKVFFVISSVIGMAIWLVLLLVFRDSFSTDQGFSYVFFLVHYPEYLLGMMLYYDMKDNLLSEKQAKICLPLGIICYGVAFALFYSSFPCCNILSAWTTALATYLVLYNLIKYEHRRKESLIGKVLASYGKNSYGIFLLHAFYVWPFIGFTERILNHFGFSIQNIPGFIIMIPVVLALCYATGIIFNRVIKKTTKLIFKAH